MPEEKIRYTQPVVRGIRDRGQNHPFRRNDGDQHGVRHQQVPAAGGARLPEGQRRTVIPRLRVPDDRRGSESRPLELHSHCLAQEPHQLPARGQDDQIVPPQRYLSLLRLRPARLRQRRGSERVQHHLLRAVSAARLQKGKVPHSPNQKRARRHRFAHEHRTERRGTLK